MSLWKMMTAFVLHLWSSDGRSTFACTAVNGEDWKAPRTILRAILWSTSSWCRNVEEVEPYPSHP